MRILVFFVYVSALFVKSRFLAKNENNSTIFEKKPFGSEASSALCILIETKFLCKFWLDLQKFVVCKNLKNFKVGQNFWE
jgi:hypothetical protein